MTALKFYIWSLYAVQVFVFAVVMYAIWKVTVLYEQLEAWRDANQASAEKQASDQLAQLLAAAQRAVTSQVAQGG